MTHTPTSLADGHQDIDRIVRRLQVNTGGQSSLNLVSHAHAYTQAAAAVASDLKREASGSQEIESLVASWLAYAKQFEYDAIKARDSHYAQPAPEVLLRDWEALDRAASQLWTDLQSLSDQVRLRVHAGRFARERQQSFQRALNTRTYTGNPIQKVGMP
jgi:hypothetical protein